MLPLPLSVTATAFTASNGELAWRRAEIEFALGAIRDSGRAILGGEVWLITGRGSWHGLIPSLSGGPPGVWNWDTQPRSLVESWTQYCARTAEESIHAVRDLRVEPDTPPELLDRLRFNVIYVVEPES